MEGICMRVTGKTGSRFLMIFIAVMAMVYCLGIVARAEEDDEDKKEFTSVVMSSGEGIDTKSALVNNLFVSVAVKTPQGSVNSAAGLPDGEYAEFVVNGVNDAATIKLFNDIAGVNNAYIALFFDISLRPFYTNGSSAGASINSLSSPAEFIMESPYNVNRSENELAVARLHNGQVTIMPDLDNDPATITFRTDVFSSYALLYAPKGTLGSAAGTQQASSGAAASGSESGAVKSPKTGEGINPALAVMSAASVAGAGSIALYRRKRA